MAYEELTVEQVGSFYLEAKDRAKSAAEAVKSYEAELSARLKDGDEIVVNGAVHRWSVSIGKSTSYKKVLDWLHGVVPADIQVLLEEGQEMQEHIGSRTTKSLKPVVN